MAKPSAHTVYTVLCVLFVTALVIADIIGSKLIQVGPVPGGLLDIPGLLTNPLVLSAGIVPFPLTFVLTDLINEFYGKEAARKVTYLGLMAALFASLLLFIARALPATADSPIPQDVFNQVFGLTNRMFIASLTAYLVGQLIDIQVFHAIRRLTHEKLFWLRATGSTIISQLVDSLIVTFIAFQGKLPTARILEIGMNNYMVKFAVVVILLTPICYLGHFLIYKFLEVHPEPSEQPA